MKTALITGANKGIGYEVARQLAGQGFHVFLSARRRDAGANAVATLGQTAGRVDFIEMDVADEDSIQQAAADVAKQIGHLDVLVNNAGIVVDRDDTILSVTAEAVRRTFTTNTLGPILVTQSFHSLLAKSNAPRIINVSSGAGQLSTMSTWAPAYSISKSALNAVTTHLAAAFKECAVNSVCPGWARTDMGGPNAPRSVEQGADTIVWLATEAPRELTGKFLRDREVIPW